MAIAFALLAVGCQGEGTSSVVDRDGGLKPGYSISTKGFTPEMVTKFTSYLAQSNGELNFNQMPPDLRAALIANAQLTQTSVPVSGQSLATLPRELARYKISDYLSVPDPTKPVAGPLRIEGRVVEVSDLKPGYHILSFWASNCGPCLSEMADVAKLARSLKGQGLTIAAVQSEPTGTELGQKTKDALANAGDLSGLPQWRDGSASGNEILKTVRSLPFTVVIGPDGKEVARLTGAVSYDGQDATSIWGSIDTMGFVAALQRLGNDQANAPNGEAKSGG